MISYDTQLMNLARKFSEIATSFRNDLAHKKFDDAENCQLQLEDSIRSLELAFDQRKLVIKEFKIKNV